MTEVVKPNFSGRQFYWWELDNASHAMRNQIALARSDTSFVAMDLVHEASFRGGLSNPLFSREDRIGSHSADMVKVRGWSDISYHLILI